MSRDIKIETFVCRAAAVTTESADELRRNVETAAAETRTAKAETEELRRTTKQNMDALGSLAEVRAAWGRIFGSVPAAGNGAAPRVDTEAIVEAVLARMPKVAGGVTLVVQPAEALRKEFQQREVERVLAYIDGLDKRPREAVRLLEGTQQWLSITALATRLGYATGGGGYADFSKGLKEIIAADYIEQDPKKGLHSALRRKLERDLAVYQPAEADVEQTYAACMAALAGASDRAREGAA